VVDEDELIEDWTLVGGELAEVAGKRGPTRLAFALLLKFYTRCGRFPRGRGELPDEAVAYVARQVAGARQKTALGMGRGNPGGEPATRGPSLGAGLAPLIPWRSPRCPARTRRRARG
jgi:hypothetical protein